MEVNETLMRESLNCISRIYVYYLSAGRSKEAALEEAFDDYWNISRKLVRDFHKAAQVLEDKQPPTGVSATGDSDQ
jgi:hypothetical protein